MAAKPGHLRVVTEAGEVLDECPSCVGYRTTVNSQASIIGRLKSELKPEEDHELFPQAKRLFDFWRERCKHPRSKFSPERFKEVLPRLREHGEEMCRMAIEGAAFDPYITKRKNGTYKRHDGWELIFRVDKFEEFCNRAPQQLARPQDVLILAKALRFLNGWEDHQAVDEAMERLRDHSDMLTKIGQRRRQDFIWKIGQGRLTR